MKPVKQQVSAGGGGCGGGGGSKAVMRCILGVSVFYDHISGQHETSPPPPLVQIIYIRQTPSSASRKLEDCVSIHFDRKRGG